MSHKLPVGDYEWMSREELENFDIKSQNFESDYGHVFSVTLSYPKEKMLDHNGYPLASDHMEVSYDELSTHSKMWLEDLGLKYVPVKKLTATFHTKKEYVLNGMNLKLYLELGLHLEQLHFGIKYKQGDYMAKFVNEQSEARRTAVTKIESMIWKRVVNCCFGKMIESGNRRMDVYFSRSKERCTRLNTDPRFAGFKICGDNLVLQLMKKKFVDLRRHWLIGHTILELSKFIMTSLFYKVIQPAFDKQAAVLMSDTDSFALLLPVESPDEACRRLSHVMDFSNLDPQHPMYDASRKSKIGFLKNESPHYRIVRFCALKAKTYAYETDAPISVGEFNIKCKGVKKAAAKASLRFKNFKDCLTQSEVQLITQYSINAKNHVNRLVKIRKTAFQKFDNKRFYTCNIHSVPFGSCLIDYYKANNAFRCYFCDNPHILR